MILQGGGALNLNFVIISVLDIFNDVPLSLRENAQWHYLSAAQTFFCEGRVKKFHPRLQEMTILWPCKFLNPLFRGSHVLL